MTRLSDLLRTLAPAWRRVIAPRRAGAAAPKARRGATSELISPGRTGPTATVQVDPRRVGPVRTSYAPVTDGDPDPGEVVWTWVPFEEHDGRGKDRPVLVVAAVPAGSVLAVQLTSRDHDGDPDFVAVGSGGWDSEGRPSWVNLSRVLRVFPAGMRRESIGLERIAFDKVVHRLDAWYGWDRTP